ARLLSEEIRPQPNSSLTQEEKMNTAAGMKKFLEAHSDITLPNGMNAEKIKEFGKYFDNPLEIECISEEIESPMFLGSTDKPKNYVRESNRNGAVKQAQKLNAAFVGEQFKPLLKQIEQSETVNCIEKKQSITVEQKNGEYTEYQNKLKQGGRQARDVVNGIVDLAIAGITLGKGNPLNINPEKEFIFDQIGQKLDNAVDNANSEAPPKYTGYNVKGQKIGEITRESVEIKMAKPQWASAKYRDTECNIIYEYEMRSGKKSLLSVNVNGKEIYNNYAQTK
ncbi:MAG: hypothetical protein RR389_07780, partial [Christensenella sp.]